MAEPKGERFIFSLRELSGALGDLGTLLPLMLGTIAVVGLAPMPVLAGFAVFYIATAAYYRLPIPVQPMKAVAAVLLTAHLSPAALGASGVIIGAALLVLGLTITRLARLVPQSVLAGLQLGLGLALSLVSLVLMTSAPAVAIVTMALVLGLLLVPRYPSALIALAAAIVLAQALGVPGMAFATATPTAAPVPSLPSLAEMQSAFSLFVLPQLSLTLTNAIVLTALIAGDYFGERAAHVTPARLSITSGLAVSASGPGRHPRIHAAGGGADEPRRDPGDARGLARDPCRHTLAGPGRAAPARGGGAGHRRCPRCCLELPTAHAPFRQRP
jgi:hypothetical protein